MKHIFRISLLINLVIGCIFLVKGATLFTENYVEKHYEVPESTYHKQEKREEVAPATNTKQTLDCDTKMRIVIRDLYDNSQQEQVDKIPTSFIGKDRKQIEKFIETYNLSPSLSDMEAGFIEEKLISYSIDEICIEKNIQSKSFFGYFGCQNGKVVIYDNQKNKIILYTDIKLSDLPEDLQKEVQAGQCIRNQEQVFGLLESYSS